MAGLHHVELWLADDSPSWTEWTWMLEALGYALTEEWPGGQIWQITDDPSTDGAYLTLTTSPNFSPAGFDRRRGGVNHLAFAVNSRAAVDAIMADGPRHGWVQLYHDRYPHAGGPDHYAGWLENSDRFKVEVVVR